MSKGKIAVILSFVLLGLMCCRGPKALYVRDLSFLYPLKSEIFLKTKAFVTDHEHCQLFFAMYTAEGDRIDMGAAHVDIFVYDNLDDKKLLYADSLSLHTNVNGTGKIEIPLPETKDAVLELKVEAATGTRTAFVEVECRDPNSSENFLFLDTANTVMCRKYFGASRQVRVQYNNSGRKKLWVYYFRRNFPIAQTPFTYTKRDAFAYVPDSVFSIELNHGISDHFRIDRPGFYHVMADTTQRQGASIFRFPEGFPEISTPVQMLEPLRYITSQKEFEELKEEENVKRAVDRFWLTLKGDEVRALNAIRSYYSSVEKANIYFSSYQEGWKSDRGLVYIIYGPPHKVNRGKGFETWLYGQANSVNSVEFTFVQVINPFSDNDFQLIKSPKYKPSWYYAVDNIRR